MSTVWYPSIFHLLDCVDEYFFYTTIVISVLCAALKGSMCLWKGMRSHTRCVQSLPKTRRSRLWKWSSPTWTQAPSTRPGQVRSSAPRPLLRLLESKEGLGFLFYFKFHVLWWRRWDQVWSNLIFLRGGGGATDVLAWRSAFAVWLEIKQWMYLSECFSVKVIRT